MNDLVCTLDRFLIRNDWSIDVARELEGQLDDYSELQGVADFKDVLASYRPGGGEYLYDRNVLERDLRLLLERLRAQSLV